VEIFHDEYYISIADWEFAGRLNKKEQLEVYIENTW